MKTDAPKTIVLACTLALAATAGGWGQQASSNLMAKSVAAPAVTPAVSPTPTNVTTTVGGTKGTIPIFTTSNNIENSTLYYNSTGLGIGRFPAGMLDVNGNSIMRGSLDLSRSGDATTTSGYPSVPFFFQSSAYNTTTKSAVLPYFQFRSEPTGNNTANTGATMNFMYYSGIGGGGPQETGLYINPNGSIHFSPTQTFPITQGPAGPIGPAGPTGATGPAGPQGPAGTLALPYTASSNGSFVFRLTNNGTTVGGGLYAQGAPGSGQSTGGVGITGGGGQGGDGSFTTGGIGVLGFGGHIGAGQATQGGTGVEGIGADTSAAGTYGGAGGAFQGGQAPGGSGYGVFAVGGDGLNGGAGGEGLVAYPGANATVAAEFYGDVEVHGNLSKASGSFKIDDPIDPANKYLYHSFVESPDMMNIYNGNVVTDGRGEAIVTMPDYFEALNRDFRYQLTILGEQFAQARIASKISRGTFTIMTDRPNVEVSWQVTGIRQDAWANAHRIPNEEDKTPVEKGHYIHPELFGHAGEASVNEVLHPSSRIAPLNPQF